MQLATRYLQLGFSFLLRWCTSNARPLPPLQSQSCNLMGINKVFAKNDYVTLKYCAEMRDKEDDGVDAVNQDGRLPEILL